MLTPTQLRQDLYRILDDVVATGRPIEIARNGRLLQITLVERSATDGATLDLSALERRPGLIVGDSGELPDVHWDEAWRP